MGIVSGGGSSGGGTSNLLGFFESLGFSPAVAAQAAGLPAPTPNGVTFLPTTFSSPTNYGTPDLLAAPPTVGAPTGAALGGSHAGSRSITPASGGFDLPSGGTGSGSPDLTSPTNTGSSAPATNAASGGLDLGALASSLGISPGLAGLFARYASPVGGRGIPPFERSFGG